MRSEEREEGKREKLGIKLELNIEFPSLLLLTKVTHVLQRELKFPPSSSTSRFPN